MSQGTNIRVDFNEDLSVEKGLRKFKRLCEAFGVVREYRKRKDYKKPSVKKAEKIEASQKRRVKSMVKERRAFSKV